MKLKGFHIPIILLIFGILSQESMDVATWLSSNFIFEVEVEESSDHSIHVNVQKEWSFSGSGGSSAGALPDQSFPEDRLSFSTLILMPEGAKNLLSRLQFFILYCCLKIAC